MPDNFRELKIWQNARILALEIYTATRNFPREELFALTSQIRRSAISVQSNIAEASGRWGVKDKTQLLMIARGSLVETQSHLSMARGLNYITEKGYTELDRKYEELARSLNAFMNSLRKTD